MLPSSMPFRSLYCLPERIRPVTRDKMAYKVRCQIFGHEKDVRGICNAPFPDGAFISGSRDITTRVWVPNE